MSNRKSKYKTYEKYIKRSIPELKNASKCLQSVWYPTGAEDGGLPVLIYGRKYPAGTPWRSAIQDHVDLLKALHVDAPIVAYLGLGIKAITTGVYDNKLDSYDYMIVSYVVRDGVSEDGRAISEFGF